MASSVHRVSYLRKWGVSMRSRKSNLNVRSELGQGQHDTSCTGRGRNVLAQAAWSASLLHLEGIRGTSSEDSESTEVGLEETKQPAHDAHKWARLREQDRHLSRKWESIGMFGSHLANEMARHF